jgi:hypothetical protein
MQPKDVTNSLKKIESSLLHKKYPVTGLPRTYCACASTIRRVARSERSSISDRSPVLG